MKKLFLAILLLLAIPAPIYANPGLTTAVVATTTSQSTEPTQDVYTAKDASIDFRSMLISLQSDIPTSKKDALQYFTHVSKGLAEYNELDPKLSEIATLLQAYTSPNDKDIIATIVTKTVELLEVAEQIEDDNARVDTIAAWATLAFCFIFVITVTVIAFN